MKRESVSLISSLRERRERERDVILHLLLITDTNEIAVNSESLTYPYLYATVTLKSFLDTGSWLKSVKGKSFSFGFVFPTARCIQELNKKDGMCVRV